MGYLAALASAALVGLFTVLNKWLLTADVPSLVAGAWTYFAAGLALLPWALKARGLAWNRPWIIAAWLLAGSVIGPAFYFAGLQLTSGVQGVLLINLEALFTALIAFIFFHEPMNARTIAAGALILAGGIVMSWPSSGGTLLAGHTLGNLLIALGYVGWATENNLGRLLGENIPAVTLVCIKALAAAVVMALLALLFHQQLAVTWHVVPGIIASGAVALGCSLALFYIAMQHIGSARTGLFSSTSALWGVLAAILFLHDRITWPILAGGALMVLGLLGLTLESLRTAPAPAEPAHSTP